MNLKHWTWTFGLIMMLVISGCINQARDVKLYRNVLDNELPEPEIAFQPETPLTLKQALLLANANNERLAMAGEAYLQTLINKNRAYAAFLPKIAFVPTFMRQEETDLGSANPLIAAIVPEKTTNVMAVGAMDVNPVRDIATLRAAGASIQMQHAVLLDHQAQLMLDVARTYFQVLYSERQVEVLKHTLIVSEKRLKDIRVKHKAGVARSVDVSLTEAQSARTRTDLILAEGDVKTSRAMLAFLINVPEVTGQLTDDLNIPITDWQADQLIPFAQTHRQDLIAAQEQVKVAAAGLEAAWGKYFPSISLNLTHYFSRDTFPTDVDWTALLQVNVPVFSAGLIHADVRTAYSRLRQAKLWESNIQRQVVKDLLVGVENLRRNEALIRQIGIQVRAASEGLTFAETAYNNGLGTNLERMAAQDSLLSANLALSSAQFAQNIDYLTLLRMTGTLDPKISKILSSAENTGNVTEKRAKNDTK